MMVLIVCMLRCFLCKFCNLFLHFLKGKKNSKRNLTKINKAICLRNIFKSPYYCNKVCSDVLLYYRGGKLSRKSINYDSIGKKINYILLIIESPHTVEFYNKKKLRNNFLAASGSTGEHIINHFNEILRGVTKAEENSNYRVALINSIQFQTSLGLRDKNKECIRDINWTRMWNSRCNDLVDRIKSFKSKSNEIILINSCTESFYKKSLIYELLNKKFPKYDIYEASHPYSWKKTERITFKFLETGKTIKLKNKKIKKIIYYHYK